MQATTTRWTARQARYDSRATVNGTSAGGGLLVQYVPTRHGVVARTWCGVGLAEVALLRRCNAGATYQGFVKAVLGGWQAVDANGCVVAEVLGACVDYVDAEATLLRRRTGRRSEVAYRWPAHLVAALRQPARPVL